MIDVRALRIDYTPPSFVYTYVTLVVRLSVCVRVHLYTKVHRVDVNVILLFVTVNL